MSQPSKNLAGVVNLTLSLNSFSHLFERGRDAADAWIKENYANIGKKTTAPIRAHFTGKDWDSHATHSGPMKMLDKKKK